MHTVSYHLSWRKRLFDIFFSFTALCLILPLFGLVTLLLFFTSGRPIFFWQERMGYKKKPFRMLKFRTMRVDAEKLKKKLLKHNEAPWPMFKMRNDPRFTKIGRFLSQTGIDELPQFFQILTGKMSIIGPRPLPISESEKLPKSWDFRYQVRPGILSEWAVSPDRYKSLRKWKQLDMQTLQNNSLRKEAELIFRSAWFLIKSNFPSFLRGSRVRLSRSLPRVVD